MPGESTFLELWVKIDSFPESISKQKSKFRCSFVLQYLFCGRIFYKNRWSAKSILDVANLLLSRYDSADFFFLRCYTIMIVACQNENEQALRRS